ncbi:MAG: winged helix-turn-helix transcriptional regulator [Nitrososphaerota archaeon]|nr:winged helix-turn-helix transcriptional regulator [Nitrososphaerota archaeon]MDG6922647.1 winged helix-turn-helix transcriptional regulator [Nitrososphaerota archaeon]
MTSTDDSHRSDAGASAKDDPRFSLKGNTLRIYMHILKTKNNDSIGIRAIQKELNLSSPTLSRYHLEKLRDMGLLSRNEDGSYSLLKEIKVDVLQPFISLGSLIIPRLFTYAVAISILFVYFVVIVIPSGNLAELEYFGLAIGSISLFTIWYEAIRSWRSLPR